MARLNVTPEIIKQINQLYYELGTYAAVSRAMGGSPSAATVKKYIISDYKPVTCIKKFNGNLAYKKLPLDPSVLSDDEIKEIRELWNELEI